MIHSDTERAEAARAILPYLREFFQPYEPTQADMEQNPDVTQVRTCVWLGKKQVIREIEQWAATGGDE